MNQHHYSNTPYPLPKTPAPNAAPPTAKEPSLSTTLLYLLKQRGWNASDLANAAGLTRSTVSNIVHGRRRNPRYETLLAIADALNVSADELLRGDIETL